MVKAKRAAHPAKDKSPPTVALRKLQALVTPVVPAWSQKKLAETLGISQQAVSNWIRGDAKPGRAHAAEIERLFGIPMREWDELAGADSSSKKARHGKAA